MSMNDGYARERVSRTREEARHSYDRLAAWYDLMSGSSEWKFDEQALRLLDPQPGEAILEIGFGTGKALEWIRRRTGTTGRVVGVDLSEGMRSVASRRLGRSQYTDVELLVEDALTLPFSDTSFDALFMGFTLELFDTPELPAVTTEMRRVLRSGGRIAVAALSLRRVDSLPVRLYHWAHRRFPRTVDCRPIQVERVLSDSGFEISELRHEQMWGLPVDVLLAGKPLEDDGTG